MILAIVRKREMTSLTISKKLGITPRTVLSMLKAMEQEGILVSYVRAKSNYYRVADSQVLRAFDRTLKISARKVKTDGSQKINSGVTEKSRG
jgi:predicted transcriptional regulator